MQGISLAGAFSGVGSWPGADARESSAIILGELVKLPHLVELPARGLGADMIGRANAVLVDLRLDVSTTAYRVVSRPGSVARRAIDLLNQDLDAIEEAWERAGFASGGQVADGQVVKVQSVGPLTLAAEAELGNGRRVLTDSGAVRDFAESLGEGLARHAAEVERRLGAQVLIQVDEPRLPAVLAGTLPGRTRLETVPAMPGPEALAVLEATLEGSGGVTVVHCCSAELPFELLRRSSVLGVGLDASKLTSSDLDGIGELLDSGKELALGLVPTARPAIPVGWRDLVDQAVRLIDRLGFARTILQSQVAVTPTCGLAGADESWSREALKLCAEVSKALTDDPESL